MMKKKILVPIFGAVVLGLSAYVGYRTYGAYSEKELESDLLLANVEALAAPSKSLRMFRHPPLLLPQVRWPPPPATNAAGTSGATA